MRVASPTEGQLLFHGRFPRALAGGKPGGKAAISLTKLKSSDKMEVSKMKRNNHEFGDNWHLFLPWIPVVISLFYLWRNILMDVDIISALIGGIAAIVVCVITLFGTQLVELKRMKRDGESIKETKSIVSDTKPIIGMIHQDTADAKTNIALIQKDTQKIDSIATEVAVFKQLRSDTSSAIRPETMLASMMAVFEKNAELKRKLEESESNVLRLTQENEKLSSRNRFLEQQLNQSQEPDWEMEP